jgi:aminopeptidase Y
MTRYKRLHLVGLAALGCVSSLQFQLRLVPQQSPLIADNKPLVDSEALQASISSEKLLARAKDLYEIAKLGEEEYNHPTRVIGSKGTWFY